MRNFATRAHLGLLIATAPLGVVLGASGNPTWHPGLGIYVWLIYLIGLSLGFPVIPRNAASRVALLGFLALTALTGLSILWAPDRGPASNNFAQMLLYSGAAFALVSGLSKFDRHRLAEPTAWATAAAASLYSLSERVFPGLFTLHADQIAFGRLSQPLGYWNAMGALSGVGLVLAARLAADRELPRPLRITATASMPFISLALWLTFSRGALVATAAGLAALAAIQFNRTQIRSLTVAIVGLFPVALAAESLESVRTLAGSPSGRASDGLILGGVILLTSMASVFINHFATPHKSENGTLHSGWRRVMVVLAVALTLAPVGTVLIGTSDATPPVATSGADSQRLQSISTNRSRYWSVAVDGFAAKPIAGNGSGSFRSLWLRHRNGQQPALNAHSLELEVAAELGILGLLALLLVFSGAWIRSRSLIRLLPGSLAGAMGAGVLFLAHSAVDWDFQIPGLMLPMILLVSAVLAVNTEHDAKHVAASESSWRHALLMTLACVIAASSIIWLGHLWEARVLQREASLKTDAAKVLGWTPARYRETVRLLKDASWLNPNPSPRLDLATVYWNNGHLALAVQTLQKIVKDNPGLWPGWEILWIYGVATHNPAAFEAKIRALELRDMLYQPSQSP